MRRIIAVLLSAFSVANDTHPDDRAARTVSVTDAKPDGHSQCRLKRHIFGSPENPGNCYKSTEQKEAGGA